MIGKNCVIMSPPIRDIAKTLNISDELAKYLVGVWQVENNSSEIPHSSLLKPLLEDSSHRVSYDPNSSRNKYRRAFSPQVLDKRISLVARQFSTEITLAHRQYMSQLASEITELENILKNNKLGKKERKEFYRTLRSKQITLSRISNEENGRQKFLNIVKISDLLDRLRDYYNISEDLLIEYYGEEKGKYIYSQHQLILEHLDNLFSDALYIIEEVENIKTFKEESEDSDSKEDARGNEGWGIQAKFINPKMTLLSKVKKTLGNIEKIDRDGNVVEDDLGEIEYMNPITTYQTLLHELSKRLLKSDDFSLKNTDGSYSFPALEDIKTIYPWVEQVIELLQDNPDLISAFYSSFRQSKTEIWTNVDGKPVSENTDMASRSTLRTAINNYETGNILNKDTSIYDSLGRIDKSKAKEIVEKYSGVDLSFAEVSFLLQGLGFDVPYYIIEGLYSTEGVSGEAALKREEAYKDFQHYLIDVYNDISYLNNDSNLIESLSTHYKKISQEIGTIDDFSTLVSVKVGSKSLQAYSYPNFLDELVGNLSREDLYKSYIQNNFLFTSWFYNNKRGIKSPWLSQLYDKYGDTYRRALKIIDVPLSKVGVKEVSYTNHNEPLLRQAMISQYFAGGQNVVYYNFGLFSDSPIIKFLRWKEDNRISNYKSSEDVKATAINNLVTVILQEIDRMNLVAKRAKQGVTPISNFDSRGKQFCFLPALNSYRSNNYNNRTLLEALRSTESKSKLDTEIIKDYISEILESEFNSSYSFDEKGFCIDKDLNKTMGIVISNNKDLKKGVTHKELLTEYFYNNIFSQAQLIELTATDLAFYKNMDDFQKRYKEVYASGRKLNTNSRYGRKTERVLVLVDNIMASPSLDTIISNINSADFLSKVEKESLINKYKSITSTDGQSYRHLESYRAVLDMLGQWDSEQQKAWDNLEKGTYDMASILTVWQAIKPFLFAQLRTSAGVDGDMLKVPHQHKNSEFALLMFANNLFNKSERLKQLNRFMVENNIDVVHFQSVVKHGASDTAINLSDVPDNKVYDALSSTYEKHKNDPINTFIYEVPYDSYHIAQNTPEHYFDTEASFGSQLRTLLVSDLPNDFVVSINGKTYNKEELLKHYDSLIIENLLEATEKVINSVGSIEKVQELLIRQVQGNPKYGRDMLEALQLVDKILPDGRIVKEFNTPLWDPSITEQLQEIFLSTFKNSITKQKINGGKATAVSSFGFSNELGIEKDSNGNITGIQCYLPAWSRKFFEKYLDETTGEVDIERIKEDAPELLKVIGYRIPTENKYSMFPLVVKGFLPLQSGGSIILPTEIITMSGMDFDIDSVYLMFHSFETADDGTVRSIKFDSSKGYEENSKEARDNEIIDIAHYILTNSGDKIFNCNNFDTIEKMANIFRIIKDPNLITKFFGEPITTSNYRVLADKLLNITGKSLIKFVKENKAEKNPLSPETFVHYHQMNMVGGALIGMYANNGTIQAKLQKMVLSLKDRYVVTIDGNKYQKLTNVYSPEGKLISLVGAEFLAASVDNGKNPVLGDLKQNTNTARLTSILIRLGIPIEDIALFFNVPSLEELNTEVLQKYHSDSYNFYIQLQNSPFKISSYNFKRNDWLHAILMSKMSYKDLSEAGLLNDYIATIVNTHNFKKVYEEEVVPQVSLITSTHRADSPNGAVGHNLGLAMIQGFKVNKLHNLEKSNVLDGIPRLINNIYSGSFNKDALRRSFNDSALSVVQAFHTLGIEVAINEASKWFLGGNSNVQDCIQSLNSLTKSGYVSESIIRSFIFGLHEFFLKKTNLLGNSLEQSLAYKQNYYLESYPKKFLKTLETYPEIANIPVIKRMMVVDNKIILPDSSYLSRNVREYLSLGFEELLYLDSGNPVADEAAVDMALDLFKYSFYKDSFTYGPNNFGYLFNTSFKNSIIEYAQGERNLNTAINNPQEMFKYLNQFIARKYQQLDLYYASDKHVKVVEGGYKKLSERDIEVDFPKKSLLENPPIYITFRGMLYEYSGEISEAGNPIYIHVLSSPIKSYDPSISFNSISELSSYDHINKKRNEEMEGEKEEELTYNGPDEVESLSEYAEPDDLDIYGSYVEELENNEKFLDENPIDNITDEEVCK